MRRHFRPPLRPVCLSRSANLGALHFATEGAETSLRAFAARQRVIHLGAELPLRGFSICSIGA
jgi:hypothetical protein